MRLVALMLVIVAVLGVAAVAAYQPRAGVSKAVIEAMPVTLVAHVASVVANGGIVAMTLGFGLISLLLWRTGRVSWLVPLVLGVSVIVAYGMSEGIKDLVSEPRPCHVLAFHVGMDCPARTDWSWPSNHSVIAGAIASATSFLRDKLDIAMVCGAIIIALSRVISGSHYLHDVISGLAFGIVLSTAVWVAFTIVRKWRARYSAGANSLREEA